MEVLGYPAALLLLCSVDAIGQGVLPKTQELTRLDVLADPLFDSVLTVRELRLQPSRVAEIVAKHVRR